MGSSAIEAEKGREAERLALIRLLPPSLLLLLAVIMGVKMMMMKKVGAGDEFACISAKDSQLPSSLGSVGAQPAENRWAHSHASHDIVPS